MKLKKSTISSTIRFVPLVLTVLMVTSCLKKEPNFILKSNEMNLGSIQLNEKRTTNFSIKNTGNSPLKIYNYTTTCDCTILNLDNNTIISPQDSITVKMIITGLKRDIGTRKQILCTFKTNSKEVFHRLSIKYAVKEH